MSISATMVKELREKTSAGMMDCKKALEEAKGDFEAAIEWLRVKGLSAAAKKSDRIAAEGLVSAATSGKTAAVVEIYTACAAWRLARIVRHDHVYTCPASQNHCHW